MQLKYLLIFAGWFFIHVSVMADGEASLIVRWSEQSQLPYLDSVRVGGYSYRQDVLVARDGLLLTRVTATQPPPLITSLRDFRSRLDVIYAEPDYAVSAALTPNDPELSQQWHHQTLDSIQGWDLASDCQDVIVAVIDTGIDLDHIDLRQNLWVNSLEIAGNLIDDDGNGVVDDVHGYNAISNGGVPDDDNGHGSHVAGIIGARSNNAEGVAGICWRTQLMAIKFLDRFGGGSVSNAARGIQYALDNRPPGSPMIINNSWVISTFSQALKDVLALAESQNILVTVAAGNTGADNDLVEVFPAFFRNDLSNMVNVANTTIDNALYVGSGGSSNFGLTSVDLAAPGTDIYSTYKNNGYFTLTGSSMATPMVTAAAALILQQRQSIDYAELKALILDNASPQPSLNGKLMVPGILNLGALNQNAFVKPHIIYRTQSGAGKLLQSGAVASVKGFGLDDVNSIFLDGESLAFNSVDTTRLDVTFPSHAKDGLISTNVTNQLFVRFELNPPDAINFDTLDPQSGILSWNFPGNAEFVEIERASKTSDYEPLARVDTPLSVLRDTGIRPDNVCYRLRSGFEFINPENGLAETRYSDYSQPTTLDEVVEYVHWATRSLGSASAGESFSEQLLANSLGVTFQISSIDDLPEGLAITDTGFLSGQIAIPGNYRFDMILIADNGCPEQKTFSLKVLSDVGIRTLASEFGGEYQLDADSAKITRLQNRQILSWEPDPMLDRYEIVEFQIEWDQISQANEGSLVTVLRSELGAEDDFSLFALNPFDEWIELGPGQGLQKFGGGFNLPLSDNQVVLDRDSDLTSAQVILLIENKQPPVVQTAGTSDKRCFIASVIYRNEPRHPHLDRLRSFRDEVLVSQQWGRALVQAYYDNSPVVAETLLQRPVLAKLVAISLSAFVFVLDYVVLIFLSLVGSATLCWYRRKSGSTNPTRLTIKR